MVTPDHLNLLDLMGICDGETLGIFARTVVEGCRNGEHRSRLKGFGLDFYQHRDYSQGDDIRQINWKLYGKTERYLIKQHEQRTNVSVNLLLDGSASMSFGSASHSKFHYARCLAACFAYLILVQRDAVALSFFNSTTIDLVPRIDSFGQIHHFMERLSAFRTWGRTNLGGAMSDVNLWSKDRGIVVVFSDLFDDEEGFEAGLAELHFRGHQVIVFQVLDPNEIDFPYKDFVQFLDLEGAGDVSVQAAEIRPTYLKEFEAMTQRMEQVCEITGSHYVRANTKIPIGETLGRYLAFRKNIEL